MYIKERANLVKSELARVSEHIKEFDLFFKKKNPLFSSFCSKEKKLKKQEEEMVMASFFKEYISLLGEFYGDTSFLYSGHFQKEIPKITKEMKRLNITTFLKGVPSEILKVLINKLSKEDHEEYRKKQVESISKMSEEIEFLRFINLIAGKQISCVNKALNMDDNLNSLSYCGDNFLIICESTINLINFTAFSSYEKIISEYKSFFTKEERRIDAEKKILAQKGVEPADLITGYHNFHDVKWRIEKEIESKLPKSNLNEDGTYEFNLDGIDFK